MVAKVISHCRVLRGFVAAGNDRRNAVQRVARCVLPIVLVVCGCGGGGLRAVDNTNLPVRTASAEELMAQLNRDGSAVAALKGKVGMGMQRQAGEDVKRCSGMLLAERAPVAGLYVKGYKRLMPTLFTLASNGDVFWFHVPRHNVVYTGPVESSWSEHDSLELYLNAGDLFRALFVRPVDVESPVDVENEDSVYCMTVHGRDAVSRKLWIERKRFTVVREVYYDGEGIEQLEIQRRRYVDLDGRLYPASLVLHDLVSGGSVFLDFESITLDPDNVPEGAFSFAIPNGVDVRRVDEMRIGT
jgi:hypothetical protein